MTTTTLNSQQQLQEEILRLQEEVVSLRQKNHQLKEMLDTIVEHGDINEQFYHDLHHKLIRQLNTDQESINYLKTQLNQSEQQREDLDALIQTITEHSDAIDSQWETKLEHVEIKSLTDSLTNAANRRHFDQYLNSEWQRAARDGNPLALIMFDLDCFKAFNDYFGHSKGDECLIQIVDLAKSCLLRSGDLLFRYGGEEFIIVLPHTDLSGANKIANCIRTKIAEAKIPHSPSSPIEHVTISVGVASQQPEVNLESNNLLNQVDEHLYEAKLLGKNQVVCSINNKNINNPTDFM